MFKFESFKDQVEAAVSLACLKSKECPGNPWSVFMVRKSGPHTRFNDYTTVWVRCFDVRSMFEVDGRVAVLHRVFKDGEAVPC